MSNAMPTRGDARIARKLISLAVLVMGAALSAYSPAQGSKSSDIEARYQSERAACDKAPPSQDRAACLREAAAARAEARHGQLNDAQTTYEQNALARCEALPAEERDACQRRTRGEGVTSGSVSEGGIYREYKEVTLPPATSAPDAAPDNKAGEAPSGGKQ
ncbi:MAG TPA: hypothetical protein VJ652_11200 [Noviherbaspirillum sp.]|uniref:hypothetical protein n=1 Tax=Oxalobacteraceae TaxID=75682 RepID=UPI001B3BEC1E|nr:hypothetical protein [Herbaspirillum sp. ST 5-3]HJV52020.1 hypothetical protein [Noviherbaspirillum sp.]